MPSVVLSRIGKALLCIFLEGFAVVLALYQGLSGVKTDEAKYLLDIPYPHPPLMRGAFHFLEGVPQQELILRVLLATLLVQAVWLVASLAQRFPIEKRLALGGFWLFSAAVLLQSGTIMMAPLTALQGLLFVWLYFREDITSPHVGLVALLWLGSLFTAYQAILYAPLVVAIVWRHSSTLLRKVCAVCLPVLLVTFYILTNPLAIASFTSAGTQNTGLDLVTVTRQVLGLWLFAGSALFSVVGTIGLLRSKHIALISSLLLVVAFLFVSYRSYYAALFLPLLVAGVVAYPNVLQKADTLLALQILAAVYVFSVIRLQFYETTARTVMRTVNQLEREGNVLIAGGFGHEWQYESMSPIYRYRSELLSKAKAVVCLEVCPGVDRYAFYQVGNLATEVWVRK